MSSWKIPFVALNNTRYEIRIWDGDDYDATNAVELVGAEEPIVTEEDSNDDIFTPIRTQSGYIRIIAESPSILTDIMPNNATDKKVLLRDVTNTINEWCGFLQVQNFTQKWEPTPYELELPIVSQLAILDSIDFEPEMTEGTQTTSRGLWEIAKYLYYALSYFHIKGDLFFPDNVGHYSSTQGKCTDLALCVARENFFELTSEDERIVSDDKYETQKWSDVLQSICQFFGWSLHEHRGDLYFLSQYEVSTEKMRVLSFEDLLSVNNNTHTSLADIVGNLKMPTQDIGGKDHSLQFIQGKKAIEVSSSPNEMGDIISSNWSQIKDVQVKDQQLYRWYSLPKENKHSYLARIYKGLSRYDWSSMGMMMIRLSQSTTDDQLHCLRGENFASGSPSPLYGGDILTDGVWTYQDGSPTTPAKDVAFNDSIVLITYLNGIDNPAPSVEIQSVCIAYTSGKSALHISGNVQCFKRYDIEETTSDSEDDYFLMYIKWGNMYFQRDGTWGTQNVAIPVYIKGGTFALSESLNYIQNNMRWQGLGDGLFIPLPQNVPGVSSSDIYLGLCTPHRGDGAIRDSGDGIVIHSFKVNVVEGYYADDKIGAPPATKVKKKNMAEFSEDYSVELSIASPNQRNNGIAIARNRLISGNSFIEKLHTEGVFSGYTGDCWAERRLADKMASFFGRRHVVLEKDSTYLSQLNPSSVFDSYTAYIDNNFGILSRSINWRDSRETIKMIEL